MNAVAITQSLNQAINQVYSKVPQHKRTRRLKPIRVGPSPSSPFIVKTLIRLV